MTWPGCSEQGAGQDETENWSCVGACWGRGVLVVLVVALHSHARTGSVIVSLFILFLTLMYKSLIDETTSQMCSQSSLGVLVSQGCLYSSQILVTASNSKHQKFLSFGHVNISLCIVLQAKCLNASKAGVTFYEVKDLHQKGMMVGWLSDHKIVKDSFDTELTQFFLHSREILCTKSFKLEFD